MEHDGAPPHPDELAALRAWRGTEDHTDPAPATLSAARSHLESLAGTLEVEVEDGAVVRFVLAVRSPPKAVDLRGRQRPDAAISRTSHGAAPQGDHRQPNRVADPGSGTRRALIADDEPAIRGLLEALLRRAGWQVRATSSLAATERALADGEVEAFLLDVNLVGGDLAGRLAALEQVRAGITERTVLLAVEPPTGRRLQGRPVAGKPFVWAELEEALASIGRRPAPRFDPVPRETYPPAALRSSGARPGGCSSVRLERLVVVQEAGGSSPLIHPPDAGARRARYRPALASRAASSIGRASGS